PPPPPPAALFISDILALAGLEFAAEDCALLAKADQGDSEAQTAIGQHFFLARRYSAAVFWFQLAAAQGDADAMQCLGQCYASGSGVAKDDNLALMWIAKAAAQGHVIACRQMAELQGRPGMALRSGH
ncbi:MAG: hypothetical protein U0989_10285, partial [Azonexus sp.]|nr:hypothetical protein [Azonexus sp.]